MKDVHTVAIRQCDGFVGRTYQPVCELEDCGYRGPHLDSQHRAMQMGMEHSRRAAGLEAATQNIRRIKQQQK